MLVFVPIFINWDKKTLFDFLASIVHEICVRAQPTRQSKYFFQSKNIYLRSQTMDASPSTPESLPITSFFGSPTDTAQSLFSSESANDSEDFPDLLSDSDDSDSDSDDCTDEDDFVSRSPVKKISKLPIQNVFKTTTNPQPETDTCQHVRCVQKAKFAFGTSEPCLCSEHKLCGMNEVVAGKSRSTSAKTQSQKLIHRFPNSHASFQPSQETSNPTKKQANAKQIWTAVAMAVPSDAVWKKIKAEMGSADGMHMVKNRSWSNILGTVQMMSCSGFRRYNCPYELKVVENAAANVWDIFEGQQPHCHEDFDAGISGIPQHYKGKITHAVLSGKVPREIYQEMHINSPNTVVEMKQVQGAVHRLKRKILSEFPEDSVGYIHEFLQQNQLTSQSGDHDVGVLPGWHVSGLGECLDSKTVAANLHFTVTTKALLHQAIEQDKGQLCSFIDTDGTYSLLSNGYPCLIFGTVDAKHSFHLLGFTISMKEDEWAFTSALEQVKHAYVQFFGYVWEPSFAMADSAGAIHNALLAVFPDIKIAKCYFHMRQAIVQHAAHFSSEENYEKFLVDTKKLAGLPSEEQFLAGLDLFKNKWVRREPSLMRSWFLPYWCSEIKRNWFVSFTSPGLPNTNNTAESRNKITKKFVTRKERLSLGRLMYKLRKELSFLSLLTKRSTFQLTPTSSRKVFVDAQLWILSMKVPGMKDNCILKGRGGHIFVPSSECISKCISQKNLFDELKKFQSCSLPLKGEKFEEYIQRVSSFYVLQEIPPNGIIHFSCSCYVYNQYASCKHSLGCSIYFRKTLVPPNWNAENVSDKSRPGRPKKMKHCLNKL